MHFENFVKFSPHQNFSHQNVVNVEKQKAIEKRHQIELERRTIRVYRMTYESYTL